MSTDSHDVCKKRIKIWKQAAVIFMSITVILIVAIAVFNDRYQVDTKTNSTQVEEIDRLKAENEQLQAENELFEKRTLENEIIMLLNMSTVDKWSIHKRKGEDYDMFLTKGDVSIWATENNLLETIEWLAKAPVAKED